MSDYRIFTVVGARPQFVKAAAISRAIAQRGDVEEIVLHTGQHFDPGMSEIFFDELGITLLLGACRHDVPSVFHAARLRRAR